MEKKTETSSGSGDLRERGASSSAWRVVQGKVPATEESGCLFSRPKENGRWRLSICRKGSKGKKRAASKKTPEWGRKTSVHHLDESHSVKEGTGFDAQVGSSPGPGGRGSQPLPRRSFPPEFKLMVFKFHTTATK